jgi:hypothetical protein
VAGWIAPAIPDLRDLRVEVEGLELPVDRFDRRSGRFAFVLAAPRESELAMAAVDAGGGALRARLSAPEACDIEPLTPVETSARVVIVMAAFNPKPHLFHRQIASLRAQTLADWTCIILDGGSNASGAALIQEAASDERFIILRAEENLGAPGNFARALAATPQCDAIAFADADDDWDPVKLEKTCQALWAGDACLAYCDARLIAEDGTILSPTFWTGRKNQWRDPVSMLLANTVTTAASVITPELRDLALPFPQTRS